MDDLISRQAAIDALAYYIHNIDKVYSTGKLSAYDCQDAAESVIEQLPSAQQRMRGRWNTYYHGGTDFSYSCSRCGYSAPYQMIGGEVLQKKWNFCPNCGADMRG